MRTAASEDTHVVGKMTCIVAIGNVVQLYKFVMSDIIGKVRYKDRFKEQGHEVKQNGSNL